MLDLWVLLTRSEPNRNRKEDIQIPPVFTGAARGSVQIDNGDGRLRAHAVWGILAEELTERTALDCHSWGSQPFD